MPEIVSEEISASEEAEQQVSHVNIEGALDMLLKNIVGSLSLGTDQIKDLKSQLVDIITNLLIDQTETGLQNKKDAIEGGQEGLAEISVASSASGYSGGLGEDDASIIRR